ncbi:MAG: hypothetical protein MI749_20515 [Desulfovibrionales bacterium]|nr:hypothetical protein [Desulfovibrionales bacterium]
MAAIPQKLLFASPFNMVPADEMENIVKWIIQNPNYDVHLWVGYLQVDRTSKTLQSRLRTYPHIMGFHEKRLPVHTTISIRYTPDEDTPEDEVHEQHATAHPHSHAAATSYRQSTIRIYPTQPNRYSEGHYDLQRAYSIFKQTNVLHDYIGMSLLYEHGGIYIDAKVPPLPCLALPEKIEAPSGILLLHFRKSFSVFVNNIVAAPTKSIRVRTLAEKIKRWDVEHISTPYHTAQIEHLREAQSRIKELEENLQRLEPLLDPIENEYELAALREVIQLKKDQIKVGYKGSTDPIMEFIEETFPTTNSLEEGKHEQDWMSFVNLSFQHATGHDIIIPHELTNVKLGNTFDVYKEPKRHFQTAQQRAANREDRFGW